MERNLTQCGARGLAVPNRFCAADAFGRYHLESPDRSSSDVSGSHDAYRAGAARDGAPQTWQVRLRRDVHVAAENGGRIMAPLQATQALEGLADALRTNASR